MAEDTTTRAKHRWPKWMRGDLEPDYVIGSPGDTYLDRWWVFPRNNRFNVYVHRFVRSDDPRACHDHPWWNVSVILSRHGYIEWVRDPVSGAELPYPRRAFRPYFRQATTAHRVELRFVRRDGVWVQPAVWSIFIMGRRVRDWGFWCGMRWVPWKDFTRPTPGGGNEIGPGCDA